MSGFAFYTIAAHTAKLNANFLIQFIENFCESSIEFSHFLLDALVNRYGEREKAHIHSEQATKASKSPYTDGF